MYPLRPLRPYNFPTFHGRIITPQLTTNPVAKITRLPFERIPERTNDFSLWLWQVDGETVHYGLVAYEEIVLLLCVVVSMAFFTSPLARRGVVFALSFPARA